MLKSFVGFLFEFSQILRIGSFDFIYFIIDYFYYKNIWEEIIWLLQNNWNIGGKMLKSFIGFYSDFICIKKYCMFSKYLFCVKKMFTLF